MKSFNQFWKEINEQTLSEANKVFDTKDMVDDFGKRSDVEYSMKAGSFSATVLDADIPQNKFDTKKGSVPSLKRMDRDGKKGMAHLDLEQEVVWDGEKYWYGYDKKNDNWFRIQRTGRVKAKFINKMHLDALKRRDEWPPEWEKGK